MVSKAEIHSKKTTEIYKLVEMKVTTEARMDMFLTLWVEHIAY